MALPKGAEPLRRRISPRHIEEVNAMTILTNTTDRKALVKAIAEELHTDYRYLRTPTYAYEVGDFTIDRYGNIIGDDFTPLMGFLLQGGYITEDAVAAQAAQSEDAETPAEEESPVTEPAEEDATEVPAAEEDITEVPGIEPVEEDIAEVPGIDVAEEDTELPDADAAEDTIEMPASDTIEEGSTDDTKDSNTDSEAPTSMLSSIDEQTITIPAPDITVEQLRNLTYTLYSRQYILNLMTGGDTIHIPLELIEALQEALPATPEDFTALLESHRELGLKGYDFKDGQFSMTFPFYETEPIKWTTFAGLQGRILLAAREAKRVFPELIQPDEEAEKYTAHIWLQRMGYKGPEMKEQRNILLKHLHGYCAFSNGAKMQNHKDKYSTIRRERREAERAAAAEAIVEAIAPTATEDKPSAEPDAEEVAVNE